MKSQGEAKVAANAQAGKAAAEEKTDFSDVVIEPLFEGYVDFDTFSKAD